MAAKKWIKIKTDMFENEKIKLIEQLPEGDTVIALWFRWYLQSSKDKSFQIQNISDYPMEEYLAILANKTTPDVTRALKVLVDYELIESFEGYIKINRFWLTNQEWRNTVEAKRWRNRVFARDNYTCQKCGVRGGKLNAHHIKPFAKYEELRFELSNGMTLCYKCHKEVHHG